MYRYLILVILILATIACGSSPAITLTPIPYIEVTATDPGSSGDQVATATNNPTAIPPSPVPTDTPDSIPPNPVPTLIPDPDAIRITFDTGAISATYSGTLNNDMDTFLIDVQAGQTMNISIEADGVVGLSVASPSGQPLKHSAVGGPVFGGELPENGDYHISVVSLYDDAGTINYTMTIVIPPLETTN